MQPVEAREVERVHWGRGRERLSRVRRWAGYNAGGRKEEGNKMTEWREEPKEEEGQKSKAAGVRGRDKSKQGYLKSHLERRGGIISL